MVNSCLLIGLFAIFILVSAVHATEMEAILEDSSPATGFSVKDGEGNTLARFRGDGNVGIGTIKPDAKLDINGDIKIADGTQGAGKVLTSNENGLATWQNAQSMIPSGMIAFFAGSCPSGFSEYTQAQGRVVVVLPNEGTIAGTVGTSMTDLQDVMHTYSLSNVTTDTAGSHQHGRESLGGGCQWFGDDNCDNSYRNSPDGSHSHNVSGNIGSSSHIMPYIQLRACIAL